jgi:alpha-tubulin suppressor-like RCC1 family protein
MALDFPNSPTLNQIYTDATSGFSYQWNGSVWISTSPSSVSNIQELDDISSSFNGSNTIFPLSVGGVSVSPASTNQLLISVGGVMQNPSNDFYISGSNIVFTDAPQAGLTFFGTLLGTAVPIGITTLGNVYNRQTYSVTGVQTNFSFPSGYTVGYLDVFRNGARLIAGDDFTATTGSSFDLNPPAQNGDNVEAIGYIVSSIAITQGSLVDLTVNRNATILGITTIGASAGIGQTALLVQGNARVTGILTVGTGSVTINGTTDRINVGTGLTLSSGGITAGIITATSFVGDGSSLTGVRPSQQTVTSVSGITTINLSSGSVIYFTHNTDTTVAFANTSTTQEITFIRTKDNTGTARAITWPTSVKWPVFGIPPVLQLSGNTNNAQTFRLITRDGGVTWYAWEDQRFSGTGILLLEWGYNNSGQLGQNNRIDASSPVQIPGTTWSSFSGGAQHSLSTKIDGTLWSWGLNGAGQLGQNNIINYSSPVQIPGTTWNRITSGSYYSLATKTDGTLWSWGNNQFGQLGQNNRAYTSSPVQIPGTTWNSIAGGSSHTLATKTDGTLWAWGRNNSGPLGQNNITYRSSPVQIPGTIWSSTACGSNYSLATKTDGTLWAWGYNFFGQLGQNNKTYYSSPIQIPGTTWSKVAAGYYHSLATKTDGTLWSWGYNSLGQLGQSNRVQYSSPVQIPGTTWSSVAANNVGNHSLSTKTDGTLWSWGYNKIGQLAQNDGIDRSSPVQILGTGWTSIAAGAFNSMGTYVVS